MDDEQTQYAIELLAKEYNLQEGVLHPIKKYALYTNITPDATMKVSLSILHRVYQSLQEKNERKENGEQEFLDPEEHLFFIDSYDMPLYRWSQTRSTFEKYVCQAEQLFFLLIQVRIDQPHRPQLLAALIQG
jgi:DNA polymerase epsilon subunit 2